MPSRAHDATRPTIYLDQSTLSDVFRSALDPPTASATYRPLKAWVERVANEANLCLSVGHIFELARTPEKYILQREGIAAWIESMPTVWLRSPNDVIPDEAEDWTKRAAGILSGGLTPFARDVLGSFGSRYIEGIVVDDPTSIIAFLDTATDPEIRDRPKEMNEIVEAFRLDERWVEAAGWSEDRKARETAEKSRRDIWLLAFEAMQRMRERDDPDRPEDSTIVTLPDALVALVEREPTSLPSWRIRRALSSHLSSGYRCSGPSKDASSDFGDFVHASVAAAYCDVFTCDGRVATALRGARERIGRSPPLTSRKNPLFVEQLMATWP